MHLVHDLTFNCFLQHICFLSARCDWQTNHTGRWSESREENLTQYVENQMWTYRRSLSYSSQRNGACFRGPILVYSVACPAVARWRKYCLQLPQAINHKNSVGGRWNSPTAPFVDHITSHRRRWSIWNSWGQRYFERKWNWEKTIKNH